METLHTHHMLKRQNKDHIYDPAENSAHTDIKCKHQTHLRISQSSRPWGSALPYESHADTCKLGGGDSAARSSGPPGTPTARLPWGAPRLPRPRSTPAIDRWPCRTAPGCIPARPPNSLRMQILSRYLQERLMSQVVKAACCQHYWVYCPTIQY